jgi:hypothetical protein
VSVCETFTVPSTVVELSAVPVLVVAADETTPIVVTLVWIVVSPVEMVVELVEEEVDRIDVKVVVLVPAAAPVTVVVVETVLVISGG